jgi:hypothetical protein
MRSTEAWSIAERKDTHHGVAGTPQPPENDKGQGERVERDGNAGRPTALGCPAWSSSGWGSATFDRCAV